MRIPWTVQKIFRHLEYHDCPFFIFHVAFLLLSIASPKSVLAPYSFESLRFVAFSKTKIIEILNCERD